ncbi:hypothetical protein ACLK1S_18870 [Escherichia coli]
MNIPGTKSRGFFILSVRSKLPMIQVVATFWLGEAKTAYWESVPRGPALINNRGVSKGLERESPSEEGALQKERVMMKLVIILIVLLLVQLASLLTADGRERSSLTLVPFLLG